jgi:hypothetical protein
MELFRVNTDSQSFLESPIMINSFTTSDTIRLCFNEYGDAYSFGITNKEGIRHINRRAIPNFPVTPPEQDSDVYNQEVIYEKIRYIVDPYANIFRL